MRGTLRRVVVLAYALWASAWGTSFATAQASEALTTVTVRVVEIAGGHVYVAPGQRAGLRRGDVVVLGKQRFTVSAVATESALLEGPVNGVKVGRSGQARVRPAEQTSDERLQAPEPLAAYDGQWPRARLPANTQTPRPIPLGPIADDSRADALMTLGGAGVVPLAGAGERFARSELRGRVHYEPFRELPLRLDADAAAQLWLGGEFDGRSRPLLRVRELQVAYGEQSAMFGALGRLRYASRTLGMLDGARVQAPIAGGLTLGAFGGIVPDPLDGTPRTDASRFGVGMGYEDASAALRPRVAVDAHASRFDGRLDERRLTAVVDLFPGEHRASAYGELSAFDADNPWNAPELQLTAAGADTSLRFGIVQAGARVDMQRRERSYWLASYLPQSYLCTTQAATPIAASEPCHGNDARYLATADVGLHFSRVALTLGGQASRTEHVDAEQTGGFLALSVLQVVEQARLDASLSASTGSVLDTGALSLALSSPLLRDRLDVSVRYRPAVSRYLADTGSFVEHGFGASALVHLLDELDLSVDADAITGRDVDVLLVQALAAWRPAL